MDGESSVLIVRGSHWLSRSVFLYVNGKRAGFYSYEIDGLRGIAVIAVFLFHLDVAGFAGGWLGVDAFFVISGYLITRIIVADIQTGRFHYGRFLLKRARRLLPGLAVMTGAVTLLAWGAFGPAQLARFGDSVVGVAGYFSNITFMLDNGYFRQSDATTPLLHTWSLAVEEQFYVVFPLILLMLFARKKNWIRPALFVLTLLSLVAWLVFRQFEPFGRFGDWSFYLLPTRAWEFGVGALLACGFPQLMSSSMGGGAQGTFWASVGAVLFPGALMLGGLWPDSGIPSLFMVASVALLLVFAPGSGLARFLSFSWLRGLGVLSYGIYLWHFPLIAFTKTFRGEDSLGVGPSLVVIIVTLALAVLSLRFVENPVRLSEFKQIGATALTIAFFALFAAAGFATSTVNNAFFDETASARALSTNEWVYFSDLNERIFQQRRLENQLLPEAQTVVMGSSRSMQLGSGAVGEKVLNLSVSGASLEDIYALGLGGVHRTGASTIIVGLDPWTLHEQSGQRRWVPVTEQYEFWRENVINRRALNTIKGQEIPLVNAEMFSAARLYGAIHPEDRLHVPDNGDAELLAKKAQDGSHVYSLATVTMTEQEKKDSFQAIAAYANMDSFVLSEVKTEELRRLVEYLQAQEVEVVLVLAPYHPVMFENYLSENAGYLEAEVAIRGVAEQTTATLVGSWNPAVMGCVSKDFYDGMHPKESCMARVLKTAASARNL